MYQWLSGHVTAGPLDNATRNRLPGTCEWIINNDTFLDWTAPEAKSKKSRIFWLRGKAGAGKTFLFSKIVEQLQSTQLSPVAYFFCAHEDLKTRAGMSIIRSWVLQLAMQRPVAFNEVENSRNGRELRGPVVSELWSLLKSILAKIGRCFLLVDGFDECMEYEAEEYAATISTRRDFLKDLFQATEGSLAHILVVSRDEFDIRSGILQDGQRIDSHIIFDHAITNDDNEMDIRSAAESMIEQNLPSKEQDFKDNLTDLLCSKSDGMFLWLHLHRDQFRPGKTDHQLLQSISDLTDGLERTYTRTLEQIARLPEFDRKRAVEILRWTLFATTPLTVGALTEAITVSVDDKEYPTDSIPSIVDDEFIQEQILRLCGSFVLVRQDEFSDDDSSNKIHLTHFTVKEFLLGTEGQWNDQKLRVYRLSDPTFSHTYLAKICLTYVLFKDFRSGPNETWAEYVKKREKYKLMEYAASSWTLHAEKSGNIAELESLMQNLLLQPDYHWHYVSWKQVVMVEESSRVNISFRGKPF